MLDAACQDLRSSATASEVAVTEAWKLSAKDACCDCASAEGFGAASEAAQLAERAAWLHAIGRKAQAKRTLATGWKKIAEADEAARWLAAHPSIEA